MKLNEVITIVLVTMLFVMLFMPIIKRIAVYVGALDIPDKRKVHSTPIPRLGGLGIYAGFVLGYMLFGHQSVQMNSILIGSFIIVLTGIFDDIKPIKPGIKMLGQLAAAIIVVFYGNVVLQDVSAFGIYMHFGVFML